MILWRALIMQILIIVCMIGKGLGAISFTDPASGSVIANFEGTENAITITCNVTNSQGAQISTQWTLTNFRGSTGLQTVDNAAPELFEITGDPIAGTIFTFSNRLTILNLVRDLDRVTLFCGTGVIPQQADFVLRIYQAPVLLDNVLVRIEENNENVPIDLRQEPAAFPEPTSFRWYKDGQRLTEVDGPLTYSNVTFSTVRREDAGNYTVSATNFVVGSNIEQVGNDTGSFFLEVIYGPSFQSDGPTQMPTQHYAILGDPSSLICGRGLDSNPQATITWTAPDGTAIMNSTRYDLENGPDIVRLNLSRTSLSDNGVWVCELVVISERHLVTSRGVLVKGALAMIGTPLRHQFRLTVIASPSQPRALSVQSIGATWVYLRWESPLDVDFPISYYEVMVAIGGVRQNRSTLDNSTSINVTGLNPSTIYNFSVVAVIEAGEVVARSEESEHLKDIRTTAIIAAVTVPPPQVQALCSVVVWYDPEPVFCGDIVGYDVRFFHPELLAQNVTRRVGANGTFYIIQEEDGLAKDARQKDLYVQVRVIHKIEGEWSKGISLGCEGPTSPPAVPSVHFVLKGVTYTNNSAVPLSEVGEGENALLCKTDKEDCCGTPPNRFGEFYYPTDIKVLIANEQQGFYRNRGEKVIRLNRRDGTTSPLGRYRCEVPDAKGSMQIIYITLN